VTAARLSFASVVNDRTVAERFLLPSLGALDEEAPTFLLSNEENALGTNIAQLYNILKRLEGPRVRAFVHSDLTFASDLVRRLTAAMVTLEQADSSWGALGIVGRAWEGDYVWAYDVAAPEPVCTLDSCFIVTRADLGIDFDAKRFDDLHCYVEDYCLQCHDNGYGVWVVPASARHEGTTHAREGSRWGRYDRYRRRLDRKWRRRYPGFTTT